MDLESESLRSELIRGEKWSELRRHYAQQMGHSWEQAWLHLKQSDDRPLALKEFQESLRDPHFEEASYLMLRVLGAKGLDVPVSIPQSLKFFDAFQNGDLRPLVVFLCAKQEHLAYAEPILNRVLESGKIPKEDELRVLERIDRLDPRAHLLLSLLWGERLGQPSEAAQSYESGLKKIHGRRLESEILKRMGETDLVEKIRSAMNSKDSLSLKRYWAALDRSLESRILMGARDAADLERFRRAVDAELAQLRSERFSGWYTKISFFSPRAIYRLMDSPYQESGTPPFTGWGDFFSSTRGPVSSWNLQVLEKETALSCWQILVEVDQKFLSEALLRFPSQERFLFLWSLQTRTKAPPSDKRWPKDRLESDVVRQNLKRAFERSTNKLIWFDRLRAAGCSQDLYDYILSQIEPPIGWILDDLEKHWIDNSPAVRAFIVKALSITAPNPTESHQLKDSQIKILLRYLTPSERQEVLLSRFILAPIPVALLDEENLELLWDAQSRVGADVLVSWHESVMQYISKRSVENLQERHWNWIRSAWHLDARFLERFAPSAQSSGSYPWQDYLAAAEKHQALGLMLTCLRFLPDVRVKADLCRTLIGKSHDQRLLFAIESIPHAASRLHLLSEWYLERGDSLRAFEFQIQEIDETPVMNDWAVILKKLMGLARLLPREHQKAAIHQIDEKLKEAVSLGVLDVDLLRAFQVLAEKAQEYDLAIRWGIHEWFAARESDRASLLDRLTGVCTAAGRFEEVQKLLVSYLFQGARPDALGFKVIHLLGDPESVFRLNHFRGELVEKAMRLFPLHEQFLAQRALTDHRAVVLWECFYGAALKPSAELEVLPRAKSKTLWGLTEAFSDSEDFAPFLRFFDGSTYQEVAVGEQPAQIFRKIFKDLGLRPSIQVRVALSLPQSLSIRFDPYEIVIKKTFFDEITTEGLEALAWGMAQLVNDREKGLFKELSLIERFFQGSLLSEAGLKRLIQFYVRLALREEIIHPGLLEAGPEQLLRNLPFLNHILIFFMGPDFQRKVRELGLRY